MIATCIVARSIDIGVGSDLIWQSEWQNLGESLATMTPARSSKSC